MNLLTAEQLTKAYGERKIFDEADFSIQEGEKIDMGVLVPDAIPEMLRKMAESRRFGDMGLNCFVDWLDVEKGEQFAALAIETGDGSVYLSFRGTDDTLAGWKEDFELACMPEVPAQKKAVAYTRAAAKQFGISKSTVHKDLSQRLPTFNRTLYLQVKEILEQNKAERHIRGGIATRRKYKGE